MHDFIQAGTEEGSFVMFTVIVFPLDYTSWYSGKKSLVVAPNFVCFIVVMNYLFDCTDVIVFPIWVCNAYETVATLFKMVYCLCRLRLSTTMAKKNIEQEPCICEQNPGTCKVQRTYFPFSMQPSCCIIVKNKIKSLASFHEFLLSWILYDNYFVLILVHRYS
jgi:hypothetical protein